MNSRFNIQLIRHLLNLTSFLLSGSHPWSWSVPVLHCFVFSLCSNTPTSTQEGFLTNISKISTKNENTKLSRTGNSPGPRSGTCSIGRNKHFICSDLQSIDEANTLNGYNAPLLVRRAWCFLRLRNMNCKMHPLYRNLHMLTTKAGRDVHESTCLMLLYTG